MSIQDCPPEEAAAIWQMMEEAAFEIKDPQHREEFQRLYRNRLKRDFPNFTPLNTDGTPMAGWVETGANVFSYTGDVFQTLNPIEWHDADPPARQWMLDGWLPRRRAAYLTGAGGVGKSLLGQQLATCIAQGLPFLGVDTAQGPAIYLTAEDDADELRRRQRAICRALGITEAELQGKLILISLFGLAGNEMVRFSREAAQETLPAWAKLQNTARATGARLVVLDNVSHVFGGNEIDRLQVTTFANLLNGLAQEIDGTVLLIGHPNKQGDSYSGSTAWENAFRARLYFDAPKSDHAHSDPDARQLSLPKANYARKGSTIDVRWHDGALVTDDDNAPSSARQLREISASGAENDAFLRCLDKATEDRRAVSHVPGVNYAPKIFAAMIEGKGCDERLFARAMERLIHTKQIALDQPLWKDQYRKWKHGIARAATHPSNTVKSLKSVAATPAATSCGDPAATISQIIEKPCGAPAVTPAVQPPIPYGDMGAPNDWGPPHPLDDPYSAGAGPETAPSYRWEPSEDDWLADEGDEA